MCRDISYGDLKSIAGTSLTCLFLNQWGLVTGLIDFLSTDVVFFVSLVPLPFSKTFTTQSTSLPCQCQAPQSFLDWLNFLSSNKYSIVLVLLFLTLPC